MKCPSFPLSVDYHVTQRCNMRCNYCFATFRDVLNLVRKGMLPKEDALALTRVLAKSFSKVTFAGGEPTGCPWLGELIAAAKEEGATTMLVTNGSLLTHEYLETLNGLDWITLSIDGLDSALNQKIGRTTGTWTPSAEDYLRIGSAIRARGIRLKVNVVVSCANTHTDMTSFLRELRPERVKLLQVLPVGGQNDAHVRDFLISEEEFARFVVRHVPLERDGIVVQPEDNEHMTGSYAMVDPAGRFFDNTSGQHTYSAPILEVGIEKAWEQVRFSMETFKARGGVYAWGTSPAPELPRLVCVSGVSGAGKDEVGKILTEKYGYIRVAIADPLKALVMLLFGFGANQLWGDQRNQVDPVHGLTPRRAFQRVGEVCREIDAAIWIRFWRSRVQPLLDSGHRIVCTDLRLEEELKVAREMGGVIWRVERPGARALGEAAKDVTETEAGAHGSGSLDAVIRNDGTLEELGDAVVRALKQERSK